MKLFTVIVLCAGLNMGYAGGDDLPVNEVSESEDVSVDKLSESEDVSGDESSESDDLIEIQVDVGQTPSFELAYT